MKNSYPRPQFKRQNWLNLNGQWQFAFDQDNCGIKDKWYQMNDLPNQQMIEVPFCVQSELSGIDNQSHCDVSWYKTTFKVEHQDQNGVILHFGAVDYSCDVYVNGEHVTKHQGGHISFNVDITNHIQESYNQLHVRVFDDMFDIEIPRGKQYWKEESESIFYTRTSGIWQTVWLEIVPDYYIKRVKFIPDILTNSIKVGFYLNKKCQAEIQTEIRFEDTQVVSLTRTIEDDYYETVYFLGKANDQGTKRLWSPENPNLYDVTFTLVTDRGKDVVNSYFGMRKISVEKGIIMLNNRPYFMRLVLDQGYYPKGLMTSPDDSYIQEDIRLTKAMGFNGVRKHQKIEEPRYLYYADKLGLLVWEEMPSAYKFSAKMMQNVNNEWSRVIDRDYNHPSIVVWVPINESWGVPNLISNKCEVHYLESLYHLTKAKDDTRLVVSNDGWEHGTTDLLTIHDYESDYNKLIKRYQDIDTIINSIPGHHVLFNENFHYQNEPILVTEFGGISYQKGEKSGWGYSNATSNKDFIKRLENVVSPLYESPNIQGFCYTQLTDIEQEINGLLTFDREPKISLAEIRNIIKNKR